MAKIKMTNRQTMINKTQQRKLNSEKLKIGVNSRVLLISTNAKILSRIFIISITELYSKMTYFWFNISAFSNISGNVLMFIFRYLLTGVQHDFHVRWCSCYLTVTRRVSLVEQELLSFPEHTCSPPYFSGVRVTRSLVLCVCFVDRCLSFCTFSFGLCAVCPPIYEFGLLLWYLQILLNRKDTVACTIYISSMTRNKK
jgi:hypothetical protein